MYYIVLCSWLLIFFESTVDNAVYINVIVADAAVGSGMVSRPLVLVAACQAAIQRTCLSRPTKKSGVKLEKREVAWLPTLCLLRRPKVIITVDFAAQLLRILPVLLCFCDACKSLCAVGFTASEVRLGWRLVFLCSLDFFVVR